MAKFKIPGASNPIPESPALLFRDLTKKDPAVSFLWDHQGKILDDYFGNHLESKNLAIELPTGAGKTLVALLICEYRRRARGEKTVILCPTKQLCYQVGEQAKKFGILADVLVGSKAQYPPEVLARYSQARSIVVTTYSSLFNSAPGITMPDVVVCDDAHAGDNYIAKMWTVSISRRDYPDVFNGIVRRIKDVIPNGVKHHIDFYGRHSPDPNFVEELSAIASYDLLTELKGALTELTSGIPNLHFPWRLIQDNLETCGIFLSEDKIEIRPYIPPTRTLPDFWNAKQRLYLSATLGDDGDLERIFGVPGIAHLPIPGGWDKRGIGRRFIVIPSLAPSATVDFYKLIKLLVLAPDKKTAEKRIKSLATIYPKVLTNADIQDGLAPFTSAPPGTALVIANRYEGIDLPGDTCRAIWISGLPTGSGLQEKYLVYRLGASAQYRDRVRTRVTQAIGRCTRNESDYSFVFLTGGDLMRWILDPKNTRGIHPEIQAELSFGIQHSEDLTTESLTENLTSFFAQDDDWQPVNQYLQQLRTTMERHPDDSAKQLQEAVKHEIECQYLAWNGDYTGALESARKVVATLAGGDELRPYRAFWHHRVAVFAFLIWKQSNDTTYKTLAIDSLDKASKSTIGVRWYASLRDKLAGSQQAAPTSPLPLTEWFTSIQGLLTEWGTQGGKFDRKCADFLANIADTNANKFEPALAILGRMLGANTHHWREGQGKPDGLWRFGNYQAFVFEAKTDEGADAPISLATVRQAITHETTAKADGLLPADAPCLSFLVSPRNSVSGAALPHLADLRYLEHSKLIELAEKAATAFTALKNATSTANVESLFDTACMIYEAHGLTITDVVEQVASQRLSGLKVVG